MAFVLCVYFKIIKMKKIFLLLIVHFALLPAVVIFASLGNPSKLDCSRLSQKLCIVLSPLNAQTSIDLDWKKAEELYAAKQYVEVAEVYADMFQYGESAALYYNYANALYKSNQLGLAILNYERALRLDPTNEDVKFNLEFANKMKTDKIEPLERFFLSEWMESLGRLLTSNQWAYASIISFIVALVLVLLYLFGKKVWLRKLSFFSALFLLVFSIFTMVYAFQIKDYIENNPEAIVLAGSVSVKSSPDDSGTEVFVIHEGTKVNVLSTLSTWSEVRLADGNVGWLQSSTIEKI